MLMMLTIIVFNLRCTVLVYGRSLKLKPIYSVQKFR